MSGIDDTLARLLVRHKEMMPDYSLLDPLLVENLTTGPEACLYKMWRHGQIMEKIYGRGQTFYRPPNWFLIFQLGPSEVRLYMRQTLRTLIRISQIKTLKNGG